MEGLIEICLTLVSHTLFLEVPILNIPGIKQITLFMVEKTLRILITKTEIGLYMLTIPKKTYEQQKDFIQAIEQNMEIQAHGSEEEKAKAKQALIDRAVDFIRFSQ